MPEYRIWFKVNGQEEVMLPVNPQEVTITYPGNPTNYDVEGIGEIVVPRMQKLATCSFESFFPRERIYQTMINSHKWHTPEWYVNFFKNIQKSRLPFELTIVRGYDRIGIYYDYPTNTINDRIDYYDTVFNAVILDFTVTDKGGEPGDVYYNMTISEWRDASPKTLAELADEKTDENGETYQKMVVVMNRPQQSGAIVAESNVEVSGEVYEKAESTDEEWEFSRAKANQFDELVTRVLPPQVSGINHSVYIYGLGWVDKANCKLAHDAGTINGIRRLTTNRYD
jgi:hypothetical protein